MRKIAGFSRSAFLGQMTLGFSFHPSFRLIPHGARLDHAGRENFDYHDLPRLDADAGMLYDDGAKMAA